MELRHLRYFIAVAETLHFAQAAEQLGISPPTLTVQIQEIERTLQARLFNRSKRAVALTSAGALFLAQARATLQQYDQAVNIGRRAGRGELGRIEVGYVGSAAYSGILQQQIRLFRTRWPEVYVHARELPMRLLPQWLEEGKVDLAMARCPMLLPASLQTHILLRDPFCLALPGEHPLAAAHGRIKPHQLSREKFIVPEQDLGTREVARRGKFVPLSVESPGSLMAVLTQVSLGAGVAVVPVVVTEIVGLPNLVFKPLSGGAIISEVAALFRRDEKSPTVNNFIAQIRQTAPLSRPEPASRRTAGPQA
ncbi:LysR substrate-binding domain-containing protein [Sodalis sp. RH21]|uniref:LysR substrate-binding domain-containing protein n=1 Tax=unclassified Sodalis (in: enterobacteria) TaxID=2636512 RepID=UPI0039B62B31